MEIPNCHKSIQFERHNVVNLYKIHSEGGLSALVLIKTWQFLRGGPGEFKVPFIALKRRAC